jgi:plastocyanin
MCKAQVVATLFAALALPVTAWAASPPPVTNFSGSGSGTITSLDSGMSTACDDGIDNADCTSTLSGPVNIGGLGKGTLSATLTVAWHSGRLPDVGTGGIACAAVAGSATLKFSSSNSLPLAVSGTECETSAGSPAKPHVFNGVFFGQTPVRFTSDAVMSDYGISQADGTGTYILGATGVSQKVMGSKSAAEIDAKNDNSNPTGFSFSPATLTVNMGDSVVFKNKSSAPHTVFWDTAGAPANRPQFGPNTSTTPVVMSSVGTFNYHCSIHGQSMNGKIVVKSQ